MDIYEAIQKRRSVRAYTDQAIEADKLERLLDAARLAPSGNNKQAWRFVVVQDARRRQALAEAAEQVFVGKAAVVIAGVSLEPDRMMYCGIPAGPVDIAIAMEHISLAAVAEGLGSCWIGRFDQDKCRVILGVPPEAKIIEMMTLGYAADAAGQKFRKGLDEVVSYEKF